jgi:putative tricarboxylic transport membrane protein
MLGSQGDLAVFFSNWLVGGVTILALVLLFWPVVAALRTRIAAR